LSRRILTLFSWPVELRSRATQSFGTTFRVVRENAGDKADNFAARLKASDFALLNGSFGTKGLMEFIKLVPGKSKLTEFREEDEKILSAENIESTGEKISH
jgi:hypothetical protein